MIGGTHISVSESYSDTSEETRISTLIDNFSSSSPVLFLFGYHEWTETKGERNVILPFQPTAHHSAKTKSEDTEVIELHPVPHVQHKKT